MSKVVAKILTGSRAYGTSMEISDRDHIIVKYDSDIDRLNGNPPREQLGNTTYYDIYEFLRMLQAGDLSCHQAIWAGSECLSITTHAFEEIRRNRGQLINKPVLLRWIYESEYYFGKATRIGKLKLQDLGTPDFLYYNYVNAKDKAIVQTITDALLLGTIDVESTHNRGLNLSEICAYPSKLGRDLYRLYYTYYTGALNTCKGGLLNTDGSLKVLNGIPDEKLSYVGTMYYDRHAHNRYIRMRKTLRGSVSRGYDEKSMYHAFRVLQTVYDYIIRGVINVTTSTPGFLMDIRKHNLDLDELTRRFVELEAKIADLLNTHAEGSLVKTEVFVEILTNLRLKLNSNINENIKPREYSM